MKQKAQDLASLKPDPDDNQDDATPDRSMTPLEAASFIESMTAELRIMARDTKLNTLSYFLEMARVEASAEIVRQARSSDDSQ